MIRDWFNSQMARLAGLRFVPADLETHWEGLRDLPDEVLMRAVTRAQRTRSEFPTPVELRSDADSVGAPPLPPEPDRGPDLPAPILLGTLPSGAPIHARCEWQYCCEECSDTGWKAWWCGERFSVERPFLQAPPWVESRSCGLSQTHAAHMFVERCICSETNPALIRQRAGQRKYAEFARKSKR